MNNHTVISANDQAATAADPLGWMRERNDAVFSDLERLHNRLETRRYNSESVTLKNKDMRLVPHANPQTLDEAFKLDVQIGEDRAPCPMTYHGFGQLAGLAKAPAAYLRTLPGPIVADAMRYGLEYARSVEEIKAYTVDDQLASVTGPNYGRIYDSEVVNGVLETMPDEQWQVATDYMAARTTDRTLLVFMVERRGAIEVGLDPHGNPDVLRRGVMIRNSELGAASLSISTFLFRDYCTNGLVFGQRGKSHLSMRHSSGAPERWMAEVRPAIENYVQGSERGILDAVETARNHRIAENEEEALGWLRGKAKLTADQARRSYERHELEEGRPMRTLWDAMQGITAVARSEQYGEDRLALEQAAGQHFAKLAA